ncbi:4-phosphoerythronate dehydrogenase [Lentibacillus sp. JNUCC-1]|uniref:NAD(P)-dependent oxidoreductase n=1 Tax=Lentibacillus sp. JNUCC-1 TaxID=2654513 RepID=UPI0012E78C21|nr:NAD(P)-dependent oxidoreductase [Lentibacillus sp. JNUCC-1]MUV38716.1 4-phosphoerythronate dehydrogenase [Lentibacillus sp. JNUCC-1]
MHILFSAKISEKHRTALKNNHADLTFNFCEGMEEAESYLPKADVLVTYGEDVTEAHLEKANQLKWIMVISAGMDEMPLKTLEKKDILVTNARGIHKVPMAEYVISMLLQVYRKEKQLFEYENDHVWGKHAHMEEISNRKMLVAGTGAIGQEVARLAKAFNMTTVGVSRSGRQVEHFDETYPNTELEGLLGDVDFVVSVMPSTPETYHFFEQRHFKAMPEHAVFLNMGRGDAVSSDVMLEAVQNGDIAHAVLDVFEEEPLPEDHPFWDEANITVTPHLSGVSSQYVTRALGIFEQNLNVLKQNGTEFVNQIDVTRGY